MYAFLVNRRSRWKIRSPRGQLLSRLKGLEANTRLFGAHGFGGKRDRGVGDDCWTHATTEGMVVATVATPDGTQGPARGDNEPANGGCKPDDGGLKSACPLER